MSIEKIKEEIKTKGIKNIPLVIKVLENKEVEVYPQSVKEINEVLFFIGREGKSKNLYLMFNDVENETANRFNGIEIKSDKVVLKVSPFNTENRKVLQELFPFTNAITLGRENSFGYGDRLGLANAAHLRSSLNYDFKPILCQQSIRELTRTKRTPAEVMDAAVWAVFQEGYELGFGADADHLKTIEDIDLMVANGYKMFTFDPSEFVNNEADSITVNELDAFIEKLNWTGLNSNFNEIASEYIGKEFKLSDSLSVCATEEELKRALVKYGNAIAHIKKMYVHLSVNHSDYDSEVEISVDETESVTTPFEHFFFVKELNRLGVVFISLAPRFIGDFEKGIDYKGDLDLFKQEYLKHLAITKHFGNYKISLHSGSDKFSVYKVIGSLKTGYTHIKTAGTSYLEALKTASIKAPDLFREILDYCVGLYENEKKTYHVSADINKIKPAKDYKDEELQELFNDDNARQVLHVTFGRVLTDLNEAGELKFKTRLLNCLIENEETHYEIIIKHFNKHLEPFK